MAQGVMNMRLTGSLENSNNDIRRHEAQINGS